MNYVQALFEGLQVAQRELLVALLSANGFEGFEENGDQLLAFIPAKDFNEEELKAIANQVNVEVQIDVIPETNWNQLWESGFNPVVIGDFVAIRAAFHEQVKGVEHEIIITPKMSFGTGHHATTAMVMELMRKGNFENKEVLDFGTGTGILAILAEKLGAKKITAIDNDENSMKNAQENLLANDCKKIKLVHASSAEGKNKYDIILANIIRSVILDNLAFFIEQLASSGSIILSGLLADDEQELLKAASVHGLRAGEKLQNGDWICVKLLKSRLESGLY